MISFNGHADGIKTYHLADSIGHGLAMYRSGDAEVLRLVVEETDSVVLGLLVQLAQGLAERHIIVFTVYPFTIYDLLRLISYYSKTADKHGYDSFHLVCVNNPYARCPLPSFSSL